MELTQTQKTTAAIHMIGFEYFQACVANGATPEQAKAEMLKPEAQEEIAKRVNEILN